MNNYDDIKRFKEKLNMESIDYKEIAENNLHNTPHNWAIIRQIAAADEPLYPLDQGRTTRPVPMPVSNKELFPSAWDKPAAVHSLPDDAGKNDTADEMRFNRLFNRTSRSAAASGVLPGRDMPLSLLLENIALCR